MSALVDLKSFGPSALRDYLASLGEPAYRAGQVVRWLYQKREPDIERWTDLPVALRRRLKEEARVTALEEADRQVSSADGTIKHLWKLADGTVVESVSIPSGRRLTVCFSTQVGCPLGCRFCATGRAGYVRDLTVGEIVDQVGAGGGPEGRSGEGVGVGGGGGGGGAGGAPAPTNAVAMGQGEPFLNYDAVIGALRILNSPDGLGLGARRITVSTCGVVEGVERFAREPEQFGLAVSLHSARQDVRDNLMPGVRRWPLERLRPALLRYAEATGRRITLEYALLAGANDGPRDVDALARFSKGLLSHVNLIPANPVAGCDLGAPPRSQVRAFRDALKARGVEATIRAEHGADIDAACGQLAQRRK